jgi:crossover junction endodeoxyribonuclease RuvC
MLLYFALLELKEDEIILLDFGAIETDPDLDFAERLFIIQQDLEQLLDRFRPTEAYVEELFFSANTKTALSVAHARGVIMASLAAFDLSPISLKPNEIKLAVTGDGRADKRQIQDMVQKHFSLRTLPKPDDAADALAVAMCAAARSEYPS